MNKKIVIITDDAAPLQKAVEDIAAVIGACSGYSAAVIQAEHFSGADLLAAYAVFLGCEKARPSSFASIEALLGHINLAGRPCGIFSSGAGALEYLSALVRDSEIAVGRPLLVKNDATDHENLKKWVQDILQEGK
ncbi:MAG: hypothetical protein LBH20_01925 [Treponema sp.]|jgi:hypothetical protein|nr:hypothetical protein [Treponema sp.]